MANAGDGIGITERVGKSTISQWMTMVTNALERHYPMLARLRKLNRIKRVTNEGGGEMRWVVKKLLHDLETASIGIAIPFSPLDNLLNATLPWREYIVKDAIYAQEMAENGGKAGLIKLFTRKADSMRDSAKERLAAEFYIDGNATGNSRRWHGIESMMSIITQTATDIRATIPNDTYAGLSTAYTSFKASATAGQPEYGAWSPVIISTNYTDGSGSAVSFASVGDDLIRAMQRRGRYGGSDKMDLIVLSGPDWEALATILDDKERAVLKPGELESREYGFDLSQALKLNGSYIIYDDALPTTDANSDTVRGYGYNTERMELRVLNSGMENATAGEDSLFEFWDMFNINTRSQNLLLSHYGNLRYESPKFFGKLVDAA